MDSLEMTKILEQFSVAFEKFKISPEVIELWTRIFDKYDLDLVQRAADRVIETCQYAPKPYDLKAAISFLKETNPNIKAFVSSPEERKQYQDYLATKGTILMPDGTYALKDELHGNERKIDYVCRVLGSAKVTAMLKEALGGSIFNVNPKAYKEFLNGVLIPMAEQDEKTPPKNWAFLD